MIDAPSQPQTALDGRRAAALAVADALTGRRFVNETLREWRTTGRLAGREAALAMQIGQGAVRHSVTIDHVLGAVARFEPEQTSARLRAILYTAAYQVIWMDRIPPYAAVDQAVELARRLVRGRSPGMVNAVLRRLSDAVAERRASWRPLDAKQVRVNWDQACSFDAPVLPEPEESHHAVAHLAAATGERPGRYAGLLARYGPERAEAVAWASQAVPPTTLQRNTLRLAPDEFERQFRAMFGEAVELAGDAAFVPPDLPVLDTPAFQEGLFFVQDATAHAAALAVGARPGERVLDLCAAPGGKSVVLALQMEDDGEVLACDAAQERLALIDENIARLGLTCVRTCLVPAADADFPKQAQLFDAALVDVPCSNTGVIARRPEARLGLTPLKLRSLVQAQRALLHKAGQHVRAGGRLVYSTCSLEPEENEQVVAAFLDEGRQWRLETQQTTLPTWGPRWSDWRDGGYFARLVRTTGET